MDDFIEGAAFNVALGVISCDDYDDDTDTFPVSGGTIITEGPIENRFAVGMRVCTFDYTVTMNTTYLACTYRFLLGFNVCGPGGVNPVVNTKITWTMEGSTVCNDDS
jgi:hypothetical protein